MSCTAVSSTGTAFPCPPVLDPARSTGITPPSGTTRSSDFCWAIEPSSSRSPTYRPSRAGTQQISLGETLRYRRDGVATTPSGNDRNRASPLRDGSPTESALRRFTLVRHHDTPMASFRPALTEAPAAHNQPHWGPPGQFRAAPLPLQCWIPPVRAPGQDFHLRSQHPCQAHPNSAAATRRLRSTLAAALPCRYLPSTSSHSRWTDERGLVTPPMIEFLQCRVLVQLRRRTSAIRLLLVSPRRERD